MTFYDHLNQAIDYLEQHLCDELDYQALAQTVGISASALRHIFPLLSGVSVAEYLRKRRLTLAGRDLAQTNARVIDVAMNYGYDSAIAFSRAFNKFHGIKPSAARNSATRLKYYPKLVFHPQSFAPELSYEVIDLPSLTLYGTGISTDEEHIKNDAPQLYLKVAERWPDLPCPDYGMVAYNKTRYSPTGYEYWVLWRNPSDNLKRRIIPASRWLKFRIYSQESTAIQAMSDLFYLQFLPTCEYKLSPDPELEYYHDGVTDLLIPIE